MSTSNFMRKTSFKKFTNVKLLLYIVNKVIYNSAEKFFIIEDTKFYHLVFILILIFFTYKELEDNLNCLKIMSI